MKTIYYDNAATTKMEIVAKTVQNEIQEKFWGNPSSLHKLGREAKQKLEQARLDVAEIINAKATEIYFTSGGTEGDNWALFNMYVNGLTNGKKKHFVCSSFEHHAVLKCLEKMKCEVTYVNPDKNGIIDPHSISKAIRSDTCGVIVMYVNNEVGTIQPVEKIGKICKEKNIPFLVDAVQAFGHIVVDVKKIGATFVTASAHKFGGPRGVGFMYCDGSFPLKASEVGGGQEFGKRSGTENLAGICSMATALRISNTLAQSKFNKSVLKSYHELIVENITKGVDDVIFNGEGKDKIETNINMSFKGIDAQTLIVMLDEYNICVSAGSACNSDSVEPSYVLTSMNVPEDYIMGSIRITLNEEESETSYEEINYFCETLIKCVKRLRGEL